MNHPLCKIIRKVNSNYLPVEFETLIRFDENKNEIINEGSNILFRFLLGKIAHYAINTKETTTGKLDVVWENKIDKNFQFQIHYNLKVIPSRTQELIQTLQNGISIADSFEGQVQGFINEFYEDSLNKKIDPVKNYYKKNENSLSVKESLVLFISNEIEAKIGFKVRDLSITEIIEDKKQLSDYEIKKEGDLEEIEIKLKDYKETLKANYEIILRVTKKHNRINAILKRNETHKFPQIVEKFIQDYFLENVSLEAMINDYRVIKGALKNKLNKKFKQHGREVSFFNVEIINIKNLSVASIPLIDFSISIPVIDLKSEKIVINNKVAIKILDYSLYKESDIQDVNSWIKENLKNILEKDVITFKHYKSLLIDNITQKSFQEQIGQRLSDILVRYGLGVSNLACRILNTFKLPNENEPLHHEVACHIKGSDEPIIFGNTISISLEDKSDFIKNIPLKYYSKSEDYFKEWLKSELNIIVKGVIEFKDFRTIVLESTEEITEANSENEIINEKRHNYKIQIKQAIEKKARNIGCKVSQLLIEPELAPLTWLEENTLNFDEEYQTAQDGVSLKFQTTIAYKIDSLEKLAVELIRPHMDISLKVEELIRKIIRKKLLITSSERAYLEFYESRIDGDSTVEMELKVTIGKELKTKFNASLHFISFKPMSTPFLDNYKKLRNMDGSFDFRIYNNGIEIPIHGNFEVVGVSDWNRYKAKWTDAERMIERIKLAINDSLEKRLKNTNFSDVMMGNHQIQKHLESNVNAYLKNVISQRYGLIINLFDLDRGQTLIDQQKIENTTEAIKDQGKIDLESKKFLLGENQDKIRSLFVEKKEIEKKIKYNLANKEEKKRLIEINKEINKLNQDQDLSLLGPGNSATDNSNSIDSIFGVESNNNKKLD